MFFRGRRGGGDAGGGGGGAGVCSLERADHCCETLHALIVDTMTRVINGLIPTRHTQCAKIANIPDIRNPGGPPPSQLKRFHAQWIRRLRIQPTPKVSITYQLDYAFL